ncbi:MAG: isoleucine--tRNA ligase [Candidatus Berkelbacteria bacterium]
MRFKKVDPKLDLPAAELQMLNFWRKDNTFKKTLEKKASNGNFVFYEGPPTANGMPGIHHVLGRSFKDLFARYKTMQGFLVRRKAGWDTHGLPVELQVEKELGISGKGQIENIVEGDKKASIEKFNKLCRESVWKYKGEWEKLTERMAYWVDMEDPYVTYDPKYIESVWSLIAEIDKKGMLYKGHKVVPYCPRCGTGLSSHEVAQGYKLVKDESIYIKIKSARTDAYFLVWTTTPWTLAGNAALAINPAIKYCRVGFKSQAGADKEEYILAKSRVDKLFGDSYKIIEELTGEELAAKYSTDGKDYEPIYPDGEQFSEAGSKIYKIILAGFVTEVDGTGIVHIAPAFGEDDYLEGYKQNDIKVLKTVDEKGMELAGAGLGKFVKSADKEIKEDLQSRGILFKTELYEHDYPFCWRCESPLLYFAKDSWFIAVTKVREELIANNKNIFWNPKYLKEGRFGNWLENVNDWAISRDRYWGTPLPVWECDNCEKYKVVGSLTEVENVEPHKPEIDEVMFDCSCGGKMRRTPEVMDVWLDSGAMPFAQYHAPFENQELAQEQFPADFICEAVDQTRGWFYTLLAISTLVKGVTPYKNVISHGHVLDQFGKKMSKSKGNIVVPDEAFAKYGADVIRFFFFSVNQPGEPKIFNEKEVLSVSRNMFMTLWNVYSFFMTYASIDNFSPKDNGKSENVLDIWITSLLSKTVYAVTDALDDYDPYKASNEIMSFVNELSTWYVRRSRRRFWKSENDNDKVSAYQTLYDVLVCLSKLIAPFAPMYAEKMWSGLSDTGSVHMEAFPKADHLDNAVLRSMTTARGIVESGLSARASAGIKVRQPLAKLTYGAEQLPSQFEEIIAEEVNIKKVSYAPNAEIGIDTVITPELKIEGMARELVRNIQALRKNSGLQVEDRITLSWWSASSIMMDMIAEMQNIISKEILAVNILKVETVIESGTEFVIDAEKIVVSIDKADV